MELRDISVNNENIKDYCAKVWCAEKIGRGGGPSNGSVERALDPRSGSAFN